MISPVGKTLGGHPIDFMTKKDIHGGTGICNPEQKTLQVARNG